MLFQHPFLRVILVLFFLILFFSISKANGPQSFQSNRFLTNKSDFPYLSQGQENKELPEMSLLQNNSLLAISSPEKVTIRSLASLGSGEEVGLRDNIIDYKVKPGDTIDSLAQKFGISQNTIYWANNISSRDSLRIGQDLIILPVSGVVHYVRPGETLSQIAYYYQVDLGEIISYNGLPANGTIYPSDILIIPGGKRPRNRVFSSYQFSNVSLPKTYFVCPVPLTNGRCLITQGMHYYNAVDLSTLGISCGQPVFAAEGGKVLETKYGYNHCYGNYIKIEHPDGLITVYAHLQTILVKPGQPVYGGQKIGYIGHSGHTIPDGPAGCHLHFEVRSKKGNPPRNPFAPSKR